MKKLLVGFILLTLSLSSCDMFSAKTEEASTTDGGTTIPSAPTGVTASKGTYSSYVLVSWSAVSGTVTYYNIYRATSSSGTYSYVGYVDSSSTSAQDVSVPSYNTYYYMVTAENSAGESADSSNDYGYVTRATLKLYNYSSSPITTFSAQYGSSYPSSYGTSNLLSSSVPGSSSVYYRFAPSNYINFYIAWSSYSVSSDYMKSNFSYLNSDFYIASNDLHTFQTGTSSGTGYFNYYNYDYGVAKSLESSDDVESEDSATEIAAPILNGEN